MFQCSDDAITANEGLTFAQAQAEIARHGFESRVVGGKLEGLAEFGDGSTEWEPVPCTTKGVLEWLGY